MSRRHRAAHTASCLLLGAIALASVPAPVALAGSDSAACHVRNATQGTHGHSFRRMVVAAHRGDRLRVRGTCSGGVTITKDLVIRGVGPDATLTGRGRFRVLAIKSRGTHEPHVWIRDIRIVRGDRARVGGGIVGGGIKVDHATLTLTDSIVRGNTAGYGGGIGIVRGTVTLRRSVVRANKAREVYYIGGVGGGLWIDGGTLTLVDTVVRANRAYQGGGIQEMGGTLTLIDSTVRDNTARDIGGGMANFDGSLSIRGSTVTANTAGADGGGIADFESLSIEASSVTANTAGGDGGGIATWIVSPDSIVLRDSTVSGNSAAGHGGGILIRGGNEALGPVVIRLMDTAVRANRAGVEGGGIYIGDLATVVLTGSSAVTDNIPDDCVGTSVC